MEDTKEVTRIPLNKWLDDMGDIAGEWNGDTGSNPIGSEERSAKAEEAIRLIKELDKVLDELNYA